MLKLPNLLILCAVLGLSFNAFADIATDSAQPKATTIVDNTKIAHQNAVAKDTLKTDKKVQLDMTAFNKADAADIEKTVGKEVADRIATAKIKVNGVFTSADQLCKEVKLSKKEMSKLVKAFPKTVTDKITASNTDYKAPTGKN